MEDLKMLAAIAALFLGLAGMVGTLIVGLKAVEFKIDTRIVEVTIAGKPYYTGPAPCVSTKSVGAASQVEIGGGFLCLRPLKAYVGNDVKITTK